MKIIKNKNKLQIIKLMICNPSLIKKPVNFYSTQKPEDNQKM